AVHRHAAVIGDCLHHRAHDARRARAEIARDGNMSSALDLPLALQILEEAARVGIANLVRHGGDEAARAARTERDTATIHCFCDRDSTTLHDAEHYTTAGRRGRPRMLETPLSKAIFRSLWRFFARLAGTKASR